MKQKVLFTLFAMVRITFFFFFFSAPKKKKKYFFLLVQFGLAGRAGDAHLRLDPDQAPPGRPRWR